MKDDSILSRIVLSKVGRDKGRAFIVLEVINEDYLLIADGELRKVENPKLKNKKHLVFTKHFAEDVLIYLKEGKILDNHLLKKDLGEYLEKSDLIGEGGLVND